MKQTLHELYSGDLVIIFFSETETITMMKKIEEKMLNKQASESQFEKLIELARCEADRLGDENARNQWWFTGNSGFIKNF